MEISGNGERLTADYDEQIVVYDKKQFRELTLGYCLTIHSSQGSQYDKVCCVIHSTHSYSLTRSLLYVAASRAAKELHIVGDATGLKRALARDVNDKRNTYLCDELNDEGKERF